jgi:hypothetical protein
MADSNPANFANLPKDKLSEIAAKGGHASHGGTSNTQEEVRYLLIYASYLSIHTNSSSSPTLLAVTRTVPSPRALKPPKKPVPRAAMSLMSTRSRRNRLKRLV